MICGVPTHRPAGSHGLLGLTGPGRPPGRLLHLRSLWPRTCGCLGSLRLGRPITLTFGRKLKDLFRSVYLNRVVHRISLLGLLCCFRRLISYRSHRANLQYTKWGPRLDDTAGSGSGCHCAYDSECRPGTWVATRWKMTSHVAWVLPSCQHRHDWTRRQNKSDFLTKSDFNKRPHLRATDECYGSHKLSSFRCSNLLGKATGTVRVQTDIRTWARRKSKWTTGGYSALRRCGCAWSGKGTRFRCLKFRLGSAGKPNICSHCYDVLNEGASYIRDLMVTVTESFRVRPYEVHIMIVMDTSYPSGLLHCHWGNMTTAHWGNMMIALVRVATELAEKDSWTFPWLFPDSWWRCQMETFSALLALCEGNSPVTGEFPSQRPVMRSFDFFFDLRLNKQLSKQSRHWWFETPSRSIILSSMTTMSLQSLLGTLLLPMCEPNFRTIHPVSFELPHSNHLCSRWWMADSGRWSAGGQGIMGCFDIQEQRLKRRNTLSSLEISIRHK